MRRALILACAVVLVAVGGEALAWRWAVGTMADRYAAWTAQQRAHGVAIGSGDPVRGGWPLEARLTLPQARIEAGGGRVAWTADAVVLGVSLLHPGTLTVSAEGMQRLHVASGFAPAFDLPFTADRLRATIPLEPGAPAREIDIAASHLRAGLLMGAQEGGATTGDGAADGGATSGGGSGLTVALLSLHAASTPAAAQGEPAISFAGSAEDIGLPSLPAPPGQAPRAWPLGPRIASVSIQGAVTGPLPRLADPLARAAGWRDGGGTLEISRLAIGWGPLGLNSTATLALDDAMQPMGTATAHIIGAPETLDALAANGVITARTALAAKALLALMTKEPEGGGAPVVDVPLTLQDRKLAMGRIPLAVLPELLWPTGRQGATSTP